MEIDDKPMAEAEALTFRAYQEWFAGYDKARGWDRILPAHSLAHLMEEVGEIARLILKLEGYRHLPAEARTQTIDELALEINDAIVFLTQLAISFGIDLETTMRQGQAKAEARFSVAQGQAEAIRYRERQREMRAWLEGSDAEKSSSG